MKKILTIFMSIALVISSFVLSSGTKVNASEFTQEDILGKKTLLDSRRIHLPSGHGETIGEFYLEKGEVFEFELVDTTKYYTGAYVDVINSRGEKVSSQLVEWGDGSNEKIRKAYYEARESDTYQIRYTMMGPSFSILLLMDLNKYEKMPDLHLNKVLPENQYGVNYVDISNIENLKAGTKIDIMSHVKRVRSSNNGKNRKSIRIVVTSNNGVYEEIYKSVNTSGEVDSYIDVEYIVPKDGMYNVRLYVENHHIDSEGIQFSFDLYTYID